MRRLLVCGGFATLIALLWLTPILAKGPPDKLTISGTGLAVVDVTDQELLNRLGLSQVEDFLNGAIDQPTVNQGYEITRLYRAGVAFQPFDKFHYYPNPKGGAGYIFYDGFTPFGGSSEYDGKWFRALPDGEAALQQIIAAYPTSHAQLPATADNSAALPLALAVGAILVAVGMLLSVRRV